VCIERSVGRNGSSEPVRGPVGIGVTIVGFRGAGRVDRSGT